jgi:DNA topoisomerase-1
MPPKFYKKKYVKATPLKEKALNENAEYLVIVESPSKCEKIESYLGSQYCCISSKGHIRTVDGLKSIDTAGTFMPTFTLIEEKKEHVKWMRNIIEKFSKGNIILASDDDREGEAIAWHICEVFGLSITETPRIIFHEITQPALINAVKNPVRINMDLVHAQQARQVLDILVGYKISPYLWKYIFNSKSHSLSAGRCQTPALRLVYDNDKEGQQKELEYRYKTTGVFFSQNLGYELNREFENKEEVLAFLEKSRTYKYSLLPLVSKDSFRSPPKPFNTSRMLQVANNVLHISPKETMELCQKLYQSGQITYMRTESSQYSLVFLDKMKEYVGSHYGEKYLGDLTKIAHRDANVPHEAVRVTNVEVSQLQTNESRLASMYRLIWKNTVESCMSDAQYNNIKSAIQAPEDLEYHHTIEIPIFLGWKKVDEKEDAAKQSATHMFLKTVKGTFSHQWIESAVVVRNRHSHYSEAGLIQKLEELGIGRPSTFASIVDTIVDRGYVKKMDVEGSTVHCEEYKLINGFLEKTVRDKVFGNEKNKLVLQPIGTLVLEFLIKTFDKMFSYEYTNAMESELDLVSSGKEKNWARICSDCQRDIKSLSRELKNTCKETYKLDDNHDLFITPFGPMVKVKNGGEENPEFLKVKTDIKVDLEKARRGEYTLDELIEIKNNYLGDYENEKMYIKTGKFGPYVQWGDKRESIKAIKRPLNDITLDDVKQLLSGSLERTENNVLRRLNEHMSVRKGKFGPYVFYQRPEMKKPQFLNITKFNQGFFHCEAETMVNWLCDTYGLPLPD